MIYRVKIYPSRLRQFDPLYRDVFFQISIIFRRVLEIVVFLEAAKKRWKFKYHEIVDLILEEKRFYSSSKRFLVSYIFDIQVPEVLLFCLT